MSHFHDEQWMYPIDNKKVKTEFELIEWANEERLEKLINHPRVDSQVKKQLRAYKQLRCAPNQFKVEYTYSKNSYNESGRLFARGLVSLQGFPRDVRAYLADEYYFEVDIRRCLPTIVKYFVNKFDIQCDEIEAYVSDPKAVHEDLDLDKHTFLIKLLNTTETPNTPFMKRLHTIVYNELIPALKESGYWKSLWEHHNALAIKSIKVNKLGSYLAKVCQTMENTIVKHMRQFFETKGLYIDVLVFDSIFVRKSPINVDAELLRECEAYVLEKTKVRMSLAVKHMKLSDKFKDLFLKDDDESESDDEEEDEEDDTLKIMELEPSEKISRKAAQKIYNQQGHKGLVAYCNNFFAKVTHELTSWYCYRDSPGDAWLIRCRSVTRESFDHLKIKRGKDLSPKCVFDMWLSEPDMLTYKHIVMNPRQIGDTPFGDLNLFHGFKAKRLASYDPEKIACVRSHIRDVLSAGNEEHAMYAERWMASIVQKPWEKNRTALVYYGSQGTGKSILWGFFGEKIIGREHYLYINSLDELTGQFTSLASGKIFVLGDEVSWAAGYKTNNKIKSLVTQNWQRMEKKGHDAIMLDDYMNLCFLSNHDDCMKIEDTDRRYYVKKTSNIHRRDEVYFDDLTKRLDDETGDHFYTYLMGLDLTDVRISEIPQTEEKEDMKVWAMKPIDLFVEELVTGKIVESPASTKFEEDEVVTHPAKHFKVGELYETTIDVLFQRFQQFIESGEAGDRRATLCKMGFSKLIRKRVKIENLTQDTHGGVKVSMKVEKRDD